MTKLYIFLSMSLILMLPISLFSQAEHKEAYKLFHADGSPSSFAALSQEAALADIVFFGELHDNPIAHWLQFELSKALYEIHEDKLKIGAEMFEADNQLIIDEYLDNLISQRRFEKEARIWPNYQTDYKPMLEFAKKNDLEVIATNIPRRYASIVAIEGFEGLENLSKEAKKFMAPLPIDYDPDLEGYKSMLEMGHGMHEGNENFPKAQAVKDATMAYFIHKNLKKDEKMLHLNGTFHSKDFQGIVWYLQMKNKKIKILTIHTVLQDDITHLDETHINTADFILVIPESMTRTY